MTKRLAGRQKDLTFLLFPSFFSFSKKKIIKEDKKSHLIYCVPTKRISTSPKDSVIFKGYLLYVSTVDEKDKAQEWTVLDGAKLHIVLVEKEGLSPHTHSIVLHWNAPKWLYAKTIRDLTISSHVVPLLLSSSVSI